MRETTKALLRHYLSELEISGDVLEIEGHRLANCAIEEFRAPRFRYHDLNLAASDSPKHDHCRHHRLRAQVVHLPRNPGRGDQPTAERHPKAACPEATQHALSGHS